MGGEGVRTVCGGEGVGGVWGCIVGVMEAVQAGSVCIAEECACRNDNGRAAAKY